MSDSYDDRIFEFIMEHDVPTGELYLAALEAMPELGRQIEEYFREWTWMEWRDANLPHVEPDEAETAAFVEKAMMRFYEKLAEVRGTLSPPGAC